MQGGREDQINKMSPPGVEVPHGKVSRPSVDKSNAHLWGQMN